MKVLFKSHIPIVGYSTCYLIGTGLSIVSLFIYKSILLYVFCSIILSYLVYRFIPKYMFTSNNIVRKNIFSTNLIPLEEISHFKFISGGKGGESFQIHLKNGRKFSSIYLRYMDYYAFFKYLDEYGMKYIFNSDNLYIISDFENKDEVKRKAKEYERIVFPQKKRTVKRNNIRRR